MAALVIGGSVVAFVFWRKDVVEGKTDSFFEKLHVICRIFAREQPDRRGINKALSAVPGSRQSTQLSYRFYWKKKVDCPVLAVCRRMSDNRLAVSYTSDISLLRKFR